MEYYRPIISYLHILSLVLAAAVVAASLYPSRRSYWIALYSYTVVALVAGCTALMPMIVGVLMANAFGPSQVHATGYILPIFTLVGFLYPALSLYPFMSGASGRIVAFSFAGLSAAYAMVWFAREAVRWPLTENGNIYYQVGVVAIFHLLLWLRVYDLRAASESR